jgi:hypothetical protein
MVRLLVPVAAVDTVLTVRVTATGFPDVGWTLAGAKLHATPAGSPEQARFTVPMNDPEALTVSVTAAELPWAIVRVFGEGPPIAKSTTCRMTAASCVM